MSDGAGGPATKSGRGLGFWLAVGAGVVALVCCGGGGLVWYLARDWVAIAQAPEGEREKLVSSKLEEFAGDQIAAVDAYLAAVNASRDADAYAMTSPGFQAATSMEKFTELTELVRRVMGRSGERRITGLNSRSNVGSASTCSITLSADFEKGPATVLFELENAGQGWRVHSWKTQSPLFGGAMTDGAGK